MIYWDMKNLTDKDIRLECLKIASKYTGEYLREELLDFARIICDFVIKNRDYEPPSNGTVLDEEVHAIAILGRELSKARKAGEI